MTGIKKTSKAIAKFHIGLSKARMYKPQIENRLTHYYCSIQWRKFLHKNVKGAKKAYSHNDPKLFVRALELFS